jgi:hypothetical protein
MSIRVTGGIDRKIYAACLLCRCGDAHSHSSHQHPLFNAVQSCLARAASMCRDGTALILGSSLTIRRRELGYPGRTASGLLRLALLIQCDDLLPMRLV